MPLTTSTPLASSAIRTDFTPQFNCTCPDTEAQQYLGKAETHTANGEYDQAIASLVKAIHIPGGICDQNFRAYLYQWKAAVLNKKNLFEETLKTAEQAQKIPGLSNVTIQFELHKLKADTYHQLQMNNKALFEANQGLCFFCFPSLAKQVEELRLFKIILEKRK